MVQHPPRDGAVSQRGVMIRRPTGVLTFAYPFASARRPRSGTCVREGYSTIRASARPEHRCSRTAPARARRCPRGTR
jgi:hypothetical protein